MKQEKKFQKKRAKQRLYRNRADPVNDEFSEKDDGFTEDKSDRETFIGDQTEGNSKTKADKKRRNRRNAQRIRRQFNRDRLHSTESSELFKKPINPDPEEKNKRRHQTVFDEEETYKSEPAGKTEQITQKLPAQKEYKLEKVHDPKTGKTSYKMILNRKETYGNKGRNRYLTPSNLNSTAKDISAAAMDFLHDQNGEEDENSATEAAGAGGRLTGRFQDFIIERAGRTKTDISTEDKAFKKETPFTGKKIREISPEQQKKALYKRIQKQHIKREYAKAAGKTGNATVKTTEYAGKAVKETITAAKKTAEVIASNIHVIIIAAVLVLVLFVIITVVSSCGAIFSGSMGNVMAGSYQSLPAEIDKAENSMTLKEMRLQNRIDRIESDYPDYDEYTYNLAEIGHDPFTLINFLSAKYIEFTASDVESEIQYLFDHMYQLILTEREEERTRTVTKTRPVIDPETGLETGEEEEYEEEEEYVAKILDVKLTSIPLELIIRPQLQGEVAELFAIYNETKGAVQRFYTPLNMDWQSRIKSYYGYRKNPRTGANEFHKGLDISVAEGTSVYASQSGTVTASAYDTDYGYYIVIENSDGYMTKYAHLSGRYVSRGDTVQHGRQIGRTGSTGSITGSHLHIECLYDGDYYNPLFYFENGNESSITTESGTAGITGDVTALLNEAARYEGYPYVWGGSSPESGFDCSGFVCYVLKNSGYTDISRTTAQGLCNSCQRISPSEAQPGDIIFFTGTYNSGCPVSHVGIYCGNGKMIHAGDPIKYSSITTPYWQEHFYSFGRIPH